MNQVFQESLWKNFAAVIDMLKNVIVICPDETWLKEKKIFAWPITLKYFSTTILQTL